MNDEAGIPVILCATDESEWSEADFADDEYPPEDDDDVDLYPYAEER